MEFVSLAVDKLLEYTLLPVARQVGYVISYKNNIAELKKQADELPLERKSVQHRVETAKRNVEEIEGVVLKWLSDVDEIASKAKELLDEDDKRRKNTGCSSRSFSNLWWRHQLSRRAKKLAQEIDIKRKEQFDKVSYRGELKIIETGSSSTTNDEAFESRVLALNQIMEALADPNLNMIGVYGLGGVGKTTLVLEVAKKAKEESSDLVVVIVTVKQNPEIKEIQQQIAEMLGLKFEEQTPRVRAARLRRRLEQEENILVILDDLWKKLELDEIGIPYGRENKNFKILMTSRNRAVLSDRMNTQKNIWLTELAEAEAWKLFKEKAALNESLESAQLLSIARDVTAKCGRLPIAIVTVASSLKGKKISEWKDVLRRLRDHRYPDINAPVEVSYENLEDDRLKSIFVLAGVITSSLTMDLFRYSCGLGLFHDMNKLEEMQYSFDTCIRKLKDSCLLQDSDNSNSYFTMHDVVRDVAISIASRDQQLFLKRNEKLGEEEWPKDSKLKSCKTIILHGSNTEKLPGGLDCPNLTFLHIYNNDPSLKLPDNFFERMPSLKVLELAKMNFEFLPPSISLLSNLHSLCLDQCVLEDIVIIGELEGLKVLSLGYSEIEHLPPEIGKLMKLQLLDLSDCSQLKLIPPGVLLKLKMLEVLFISGRSFDQWATDHQQSTASLSELNELSHLNTLSVYVPNENMLPKEPLFEKLQLQRYEVVIGVSWYTLGNSETSRTFKLELNTGIDSKNYFKGLLDRVEDLSLSNFKGAKNVVPEINEKGLLELKHLKVESNYELQFIADSVGYRDLFPNLESLDVYLLSNLVKLWNGSLTEGSFSKLKVVKVENCHKMKSLFSFSLPRCLPQLNEIQVSHCDLLEGIVSDDGKVVGMLQFAELRTLTLSNVPELIAFYYEDKTSSKAQQKKTQFTIALLFEKVIFPNLEKLSITGAKKLNKIWDCQGQPFDGSSFRNLKTLNVVSCHGISKLLPFNLLENLEELVVASCDSLEVVFDLEGTIKEGTHAVVKSSHLRKLILNKLPKLKHVWNKDPQGILDFQCLSVIRVSKCDSLKYLFSVSVAKALVKLENIVGRKEGGLDDSISFALENLEELVVESCDSLEVVFDLEGTIKEGTHAVVKSSHLRKLILSQLPNLKHVWNKDLQGILDFQCLSVIKASKCNSLKYLFPVSIAKALVKLEELTIRKCNELENIVGRKEEGPDDSISFVFPQVTIMELEDLPKLGRFYPGTYSTEWPLLQELHHGEVNIFGTAFLEKSIPKLRELTLDSNKSMMTWLEQYSQDFCLRKLQILRLKFFHDVPTIFPYSFIQRMYTLETLIVKDGSFEEIFSLEKIASEETQYDSGIHIKALTLDKLPKLKHICREGNELDPILKNLEELHVITCSSLSNLVPSSVTFNHLASLEVYNCERILHLMASSTAKSLSQLTMMEINECRMIKEIVADKVTNAEITYEITFSKLKILKLVDLSWLESFCSMNYVFNFPSLENVFISQCPKMKIFSKRAPSSPKFQSVKDGSDSYWEGDLNSTLQKMSIYKLRHLMISDYPELKEIWHSRVADGKFRNLITLTFSKCEWFSKVLPVNLLKHLRWLPELEVKSCNSVEVVFDLEGATIYRARDSAPCTYLKKLTLTSLPNLKHVWNKDPNRICSFQWLSVINVSYCDSLKYLFPFSVAKALVQLKELKIENCSELENIVGRGEEPDVVSISFVFPAVTFIELRDLPKLKSFYPARYSTEWPVLEELYYVPMNREVYMFGSGLLGIEESHYEDGVEASIQLNLPIEKAMPELHKLELDCNETVITWLGQYSSNLRFSKLKILILKFFNDVTTTFPYSFLQIIPTVDTLIVTNGSFEELFPFERVTGEETQHDNEIHVKSLTLDKLPKLRHIWREGNELYPILKNLEELFVLECSSLLNLVPSSVTFNHLTSLDVCKCERMLDLMASSTAKSLGQLTTMEIKECGMIKEIVADKVARTIYEITFSKLKSIKLQNLPCLESFCSRNYVFKFPSLENVVICHCPKMKKFSEGVSETPKLQNVQADKKDENCWEGNLNSTILKLYNDMVASGSTRIKESESKENSSSHSSSQGSDHALSYVDTKGKNTHQNELDRNKQVEGTTTTKNELVGGGKGVDEDKHTQEEAFDLQKERPEVEGVQVQLALDPEGGSVKEKGGHSSKTSEVNIYTGVYAQSRVEDNDAEASRASLLDTGVVNDQNKPSTPIGQNGDSTALDQGKKGTIHEGVVLHYNNEGVVSSQGEEEEDEKDSYWESDQNYAVQKYTNTDACGSTRSKASKGKDNASSHNSSQGNDHASSHVDTKSENKQLKEPDKNHQVEEVIFAPELPSCPPLIAFGASTDHLSRSQTLVLFKEYIELNEDDIALLRDAFARCPNLWEPREDFSDRFRGLAYKTLADLLHFLKSESAVTITKKHEKEFHVLCNEAIQFGFDKTRVEEMRECQRAQMCLMEILRKEEELRREKEKLNEFVLERRKKFFDCL